MPIGSDETVEDMFCSDTRSYGRRAMATDPVRMDHRYFSAESALRPSCGKVDRRLHRHRAGDLVADGPVVEDGRRRSELHEAAAARATLPRAHEEQS